ncbi:MAG: hypothetical protein N2053_04995, partial [Chitinispirillaceae bacterium]|nr:hypothetical protein [Chitinispirillaceae bacterium]
PSTIIMSTDTVSCEMQVIKLLRLNKNKQYSVSSMPKYLQAAGGISGALQGVEYNIGEIDESKMEIRKIINGNNTGVIAPVKDNFDNREKLFLSAIPLQNHVSFTFRVPTAYIGKKVLFSIYDLSGKQIYSKEIYIGGIVNQFSWDLTNNIGYKITRGRYIANLKTSHFTLNSDFIAGL